MFDGFPRQQSSLSERIECKHNYTYNSFNIAYNLIQIVKRLRYVARLENIRDLSYLSYIIIDIR